MEANIKQHNKKPKVDLNNLAMPEIIIQDDDSSSSDSDQTEDTEINYQCAVPEVNRTKKHKDKEEK